MDMIENIEEEQKIEEEVKNVKEEQEIIINCKDSIVNVLRILGCTSFKPEIESWNLQTILQFIRSIGENSKCGTKKDCKEKVTYYYKEKDKTICNKHHMEVVMKSVGLINKFGSINKWKDFVTTTLKDIDRDLSCIYTASSLYCLYQIQIILSLNEYHKWEDIVSLIKRQACIMMMTDKFSISDSHFKFGLFNKELELFQQQLESAMNLFKSSILSKFLKHLLGSVKELWMSEYEDIDKKENDCKVNHPIFGKTIKISDCEDQDIFDNPDIYNDLIFILNNAETVDFAKLKLIKYIPLNYSAKGKSEK